MTVCRAGDLHRGPGRCAREPALRVLDDVRELMQEQFVALSSAGLVLVGGKEDVLARRKGMSIDGLRCLGRSAVGVHPGIRDVGTQNLREAPRHIGREALSSAGANQLECTLHVHGTTPSLRVTTDDACTCLGVLRTVQGCLNLVERVV